MKMFFRGNKYNFEIVCEKFNKNNCSWTLKAISKETNRYSAINNLNPILSELSVGEFTICGRFEDSFGWEVSKQEMKEFNEIAKSFLTSKKYLEYLESRLDEDRSEGEWENAEE